MFDSFDCHSLSQCIHSGNVTIKIFFARIHLFNVCVIFLLLENGLVDVKNLLPLSMI